MIDTDKYEGHTPGPWTLNEEYAYRLFIYAGDVRHGNVQFVLNNESHDVNELLVADAPLLLAEVKRLREENKILAKYMEIVQKYDDALLADGDTDPRWSELYD